MGFPSIQSSSNSTSTQNNMNGIDHQGRVSRDEKLAQADQTSIIENAQLYQSIIDDLLSSDLESDLDRILTAEQIKTDDIKGLKEKFFLEIEAKVLFVKIKMQKLVMDVCPLLQNYTSYLMMPIDIGLVSFFLPNIINYFVVLAPSAYFALNVVCCAPLALTVGLFFIRFCALLVYIHVRNTWNTSDELHERYELVLSKLDRFEAKKSLKNWEQIKSEMKMSA